MAGFKFLFNNNTVGVLETSNFYLMQFGDLLATGVGSIEEFLQTITGNPAMTLNAFNVLDNAVKHNYLKSFVFNPVYSRPLTLDASSVKTNGATLGADAITITEVTGSDGATQTCVFVKSGEISYGYACLVATSGAGARLPAEAAYSDIWLINVGFDPKSIEGMMFYHDGTTIDCLNQVGAGVSTKESAIQLYRDTPAVVFSGGDQKFSNTAGNGGIRLACGSYNTSNLPGATRAKVKGIGLNFDITDITKAYLNFWDRTDNTSNSPTDHVGSIIILYPSGVNWAVKTSASSAISLAAKVFDGGSGRPTCPILLNNSIHVIREVDSMWLYINKTKIELTKADGSPISQAYLDPILDDYANTWIFNNNYNTNALRSKGMYLFGGIAPFSFTSQQEKLIAMIDRFARL